MRRSGNAVPAVRVATVRTIGKVAWPAITSRPGFPTAVSDSAGFAASSGIHAGRTPSVPPGTRLDSCVSGATAVLPLCEAGAPPCINPA
jgi:hypothetical protein